MFSKFVSLLKVPLCLDFSLPIFESDYLEQIKLNPLVESAKFSKNYSLGLYFSQNINLDLSELLVVHPVGEIKGRPGKIFGFYHVESEEFTLFSLSEKPESTLLNIRFLKHILNLNFSEKRNKIPTLKTDKILDQLKLDDRANFHPVGKLRKVLKVEELPKNSTFKRIGFSQFYAENQSEIYWNMGEVFQNGLLVELKPFQMKRIRLKIQHFENFHKNLILKSSAKLLEYCVDNNLFLIRNTLV